MLSPRYLFWFFDIFLRDCVFSPCCCYCYFHVREILSPSPVTFQRNDFVLTSFWNPDKFLNLNVFYFYRRANVFQAVPFKEFRRNYLRNELAMLLPFSVLVFLAMLLIILWWNTSFFLTMPFTIWFFKSLSVLERAESVVLASVWIFIICSRFLYFPVPFSIELSLNLFSLSPCKLYFFYQRCFVLMPDHLYYLIWKIKGCI